jgi:flagellar protein FlaI
MVGVKHFAKTESLDSAMRKFPSLRNYVNKISSELGTPEFKVQLDRSLRTVENPNIIYPVGDPIFIHITKKKDENIVYNVIMPQLTKEEKEYYDAVLEKIIERAHISKIPGSDLELRDILISLYDDVVEITEESNNNSFLTLLGKKITLTELQYHNIMFHLIKDRLGYGMLEPLLRDIYIEDISCIGVGTVWIVHKIFGSIETDIMFDNDLQLNKYIVESSERVESPVSEAHPIVDAIMADGSRVNFIYSRKISLGGSSFTIRKFNETPISIPMLVDWGTWSAELGAYFWLCLEHSISVFICGETASGKTTTLNAMSALIPFHSKVYSVEQTPEITLPHPVWQHLITRESGEKTDVTMFHLLIASLRSRPDYIIVGEIRGKEANITFQAMQCIREGKVFMNDRGLVDIKNLYQRLEKKFGFTKKEGKTTVEIPSEYSDNLLVSKPDGKILQSKLSHIHKMDKRKLIAINFSNGERLEVTPKHKFILNSQEEIMAKDLLGKDLISQKIECLLPDLNWREVGLSGYDLIENLNVVKDKLYLILENKFKFDKNNYNFYYKKYKDYFAKRSKVIPFKFYKYLFEYYNENLPKSVDVVFKGSNFKLKVESEISENVLNSIAYYVSNKSVRKEEEIYLTKLFKISKKSLGVNFFKLSKNQLRVVFDSFLSLCSDKKISLSDKLWYSQRFF